ncbi:MAG: ATP-grasp fold amidoligase family protein [Lachnospiraceae bacterium]|nr:ATP-grasp fold amidoligase family protein [Lachnospiraceae bacterium]
MNRKIDTFLKNPQYIMTSLASRGFLNWIPDSIYIKILYRLILGEKCNLKNPVTYNEKLQWLKLHDRKDIYSVMVDKYRVRDYIAQKLGEQYLIPLLGVYDRFEEVDFDTLPDQFVMKCTHDSGSVIICKDKEMLDIKKVQKKLEKAMKRSYYSAYREWPYKNVKPRIIIEKFMVDESGDDLKDYKVMCFGGKAQIIETHENRFTAGREHTQTFYDRDWKQLPIIQEGLNPVSEKREKPALMDEILRLSEVLSKDLKHARIDWYIINGKPYFGEITFYDGSGFEAFPRKEDEIFLGNLIHLE